MLSFPNAKINLGLYVTEKRPDGYHNIESCLYPIPLRDVLEIIPANTTSFKQTGLPIPGDSADNLCLRAYELLRNEYDLPPVAIHLHKVIPMGAGLGGGSADGAFAIKMLNERFNLKLGVGEMEQFAAKLGSDCPFFIKNIPAMATGTGTDLTPIGLDLEDLYIGLIFPGVHIGTKEAYSNLRPAKPTSALIDTIGSDISIWQGLLQNDFEPAARKNHPDVEKALTVFEKLAASYYAMSGSGSAVFGLFDHKPSSEHLDYVGQLLG